jgi:hypothetical protein
MLDAGRAAARPPKACGPLAHRGPIQGLYIPDDETCFALLEATAEDWREPTPPTTWAFIAPTPL